jgi:hypothetical protein
VALQLAENVAAAPFRVGKKPGHNLFPLSFKGIFVGMPPARDAFSPLLLVVQGMESCCWIGCAPRNWTLPIIQYPTEKTRTGAEGVFDIKGGTLIA